MTTPTTLQDIARQAIDGDREALEDALSSPRPLTTRSARCSSKRLARVATYDVRHLERLEGISIDDWSGQ